MIIGVIIALLLVAFAFKNQIIPNKNQTFTENQKIALKTIKSGYESSKQNGFEIIHTSICRELSGMFNNSLDCNRNTLYVNYEDESKLTILKNFICYTINIDNDSYQTTKKYVGYDTNKECEGKPVGTMEWDNDNEYFQKLGGYNKFREIAIYSYNNNSMIHDYYDISHIQERGGDPNSWSLYRMNVDSFFSGLTGRGYEIKMDTTKEKFEEIVREFYYIMK